MRKLLLVPLVIAATACASGGGTAKSSSAPVNRSVLTMEDIQKSGAVEAFTAVQTLRPHWLSPRGSTSFRQSEGVRIYLDGSLMGGAEQLRQITATSIESIRHMDGLEATQRYGLDHGQGAVLVITRKGVR